MSSEYSLSSVGARLVNVGEGPEEDFLTSPRLHVQFVNDQLREAYDAYVVHGDGPSFSREASEDDPPFTGLRHVGFVLPTIEVEPKVWEGDQA